MKLPKNKQKKALKNGGACKTFAGSPMLSGYLPGPRPHALPGAVFADRASQDWGFYFWRLRHEAERDGGRQDGAPARQGRWGTCEDADPATCLKIRRKKKYR